MLEWRVDYERSNSWPSTGVEVNEETFNYFITPITGKIRVAGKDGYPKWIDLPAPTPDELAAQKEMLIEHANAEKVSLMSHASNMIDTLLDEIEWLEGNGDDVPAKLRTDLNAWKQYRVAVKSVDVSLVPDIEWPHLPG